MDFLEGETLEKRLEKKARLRPREAVEVTTQVLSALEALHEKDIVHRDVKPANVMTVDGRAVICDLGMARRLDSKTLTVTGAILGSPSYMSPEQTTATEATGASDVYSAGVMLYEMLSGHLPHEADLTHQILRAIERDPPEPVTRWRKFRKELPSSRRPRKSWRKSST